MENQGEKKKAEALDNAPTPAELKYGGSWRMVIPFVLLPLAIVAASIGIFLLFGKLANHEKSASDYLNQLRFSRSGHKRWQAAYELSSLLSRGEYGKDRGKIESDLLSFLEQAPKDEPKLEQYLIISLAQVGSEKSAPILLEKAKSEFTDERRIYAIWALGRIRAKESAPYLRTLLDSQDAGIRKTAAFSLGFVGESSDTSLLAKLLHDETQDVRWNSALALAELGSPSGKEQILEMLNLEGLIQQTPNLRPYEREQIMLSAVNAVGKLKLKDARAQVEKVSKTAQNPSLIAASNHVLGIL